MEKVIEARIDEIKLLKELYEEMETLDTYNYVI